MQHVACQTPLQRHSCCCTGPCAGQCFIAVLCRAVLAVLLALVCSVKCTSPKPLTLFNRVTQNTALVKKATRTNHVNHLVSYCISKGSGRGAEGRARQSTIKCCFIAVRRCCPGPGKYRWAISWAGCLHGCCHGGQCLRCNVTDLVVPLCSRSQEYCQGLAEQDTLRANQGTENAVQDWKRCCPDGSGLRTLSTAARQATK